MSSLAGVEAEAICLQKIAVHIEHRFLQFLLKRQTSKVWQDDPHVHFRMRSHDDVHTAPNVIVRLSREVTVGASYAPVTERRVCTVLDNVFCPEHGDPQNVGSARCWA